MNPSVRLHSSSLDPSRSHFPAQLERSERRGVGQGEEAGVSVLAKSLTARLRLRASKLCDPTLEKSHLHESQVTINCQNGQLKEYRLGWLSWLGEVSTRSERGTEDTHKEIRWLRGNQNILNKK